MVRSCAARILLLVAIAGFSGCADIIGPQPMPEALKALQSDTLVTVRQTTRWWSFEPPQGLRGSRTGLIFYPGGFVDARAYAPQMRAIAAKGYWVVLVEMPLELAVLAPNSANEILSRFIGIERWAVGGHSLGAAMAASFVYAYPNAVQGLVLWAGYPANNNSLADRTIAVVSVYGSLDGLATPEAVETRKNLLPPNTRYVLLEGGNHAQFGFYGAQQGDNPATMSREEQLRRTVEATAELLRSM